jgi:SAM-dependent methyltransferase
MNVGDLYDQLGLLESRISGKDAYSIHKKLIFKDKQISDLNDWLIGKLNPADKTSVLDAGCGVGKTLFMLADKYEIEGLGVSLSAVEINLANKYKSQQNFKNLDFEVASFDDELSKKFDLIIAIESIKHSNNYKRTIKNLADHLNPEGEFWLIEDIRTAKLSELQNTEKFKTWWHVPFLFDQSDIESACKSANLSIKENFDLTSQMNLPSLLKAKKRWRLWRILLRIVPMKNTRNNIKTFLGGFILDQWYLNKQMAYKVYRLEKEIR